MLDTLMLGVDGWSRVLVVGLAGWLGCACGDDLARMHRISADGSLEWSSRLASDTVYEARLVGDQILYQGAAACSYRADDFAVNASNGAGEAPQFPATRIIASSDELVLTLDESVVSAFDLDAGGERWTLVAAPERPFGRLLRADIGGDVIVFYDTSEVGGSAMYGVDAATGVVVWTRDYPGYVSPLGRNSTAVVAIEELEQDDDVLYVLDRATGTTRWTHAADGQYQTNGTQIAALRDRSLHVFDIENGTERWQTSPVFAAKLGRDVLIAHETPPGGDPDRDQQWVGRGSDDGMEHWRIAGPYAVSLRSEEIVFVGDALVYATFEGQELVALAAQDGTRRWSFDVGPIVGRITPIPGGLLVYGQTRYFECPST